MKHIIYFLAFFLIFSSNLLSSPISFENAMNAAESFFKANITNIDKSKITLHYKSEYKSKNQIQQSKTTNYYIFNYGIQGFVIISGDDAVYPVLGYSFENSFSTENMPENIVNWLDFYQKSIEFATENKIQATPEIKQDWDNLYSKKSELNKIQTSVKPLCETKWNQSPHVNDLCPYDSAAKTKCLTGCVATAMAQVMKYWEYPETGSGIHSYNHSKYGEQTANYGGTIYEWDQMPDKVFTTNLPVATLMYHCGVGVHMMYGPGGSGAYPERIPITMVDFFNYDSTCTLISKANFKEAEYIEILKNELDHKRPLCYTGYGTGGHEFVCDGYDEDDYFHINWGWGGASDGYFKISELNPGGMSFSNFQMALIGLEPPSSKYDPDLQVYQDVTVDKPRIFFGSSFTVTTNIVNKSFIKFSGDLCATIFNEQGRFIENFGINHRTDTLFGMKHYDEPLSFVYNGNMKLLPGKYKIYINFKRFVGDWKQVRKNQNDATIKDFVELEVYNDNYLVLNSNLETNPLHVIGQGNDMDITFKVLNTNAATFYGYIGLAFYNVSGEIIKFIDEVEVPDGIEPNDLTGSKFNFAIKDIDLAAGTYYLAGLYKKYADKDYSLLGSKFGTVNPIPIIVIEKPGGPDKFESNNTNNYATELSLNFIDDVADIDLQGVNFHNSTDVDIYKIELPTEFDYLVHVELEDLINKNPQYTVDAVIGYSLDGITWSEAFGESINPPLDLYGANTLYLWVEPFRSGDIGNYNLKVKVNRHTWAPIISLSNNISFGKVEIGTMATEIFYITNIGKNQMKIDSIVCPDGYSVDFQTGTLDSGKVQKVNIIFKPETSKIYAGQIMVYSNAEFGQNYFRVYGTGYGNNSNPVIAVTGDMNFGKVAIGDSKTQTLIIENIGNSTLDVYGLEYPEGYSEEWYNGIILPGTSAEIEMIFTPTEVKTYSGKIVIDCNTQTGENTYEITGIGYNPNSVDDEIIQGGFNLFPNPASTSILVKSENVDLLIYEIKLLDESGKQFGIYNGNKNRQMELRINELPSGTYFCIISDMNGKKYIQKFTKVK